MEYISELLESSVFKNLSPEELKKVLANKKYNIVKYSKSQNIAFRGDEVEDLIIILKGKVNTEMLKEDGEIKRIERLGESTVLASAFLFGDNNFLPVDIISETESVLFYMKKSVFISLMMENYDILKNFLDEISSKAQFLSTKIWNNFNNKTIKEKLDEYIKKKHKNKEIKIDNLRELSEYFSVARPSLSRVLAEYVEKGKLERVGQNSYFILDLDYFDIENS